VQLQPYSLSQKARDENTNADLKQNIQQGITNCGHITSARRITEADVNFEKVSSFVIMTIHDGINVQPKRVKATVDPTP